MQPFRFLVLLAGTAGSSSTSGCIVAEPTPYEPPPRTPPVLDIQLAVPRLGVPIPVDRLSDISPDEKTSVEFFVPMRSEDRGEYVWWALHLNYLVSNTQSYLLKKNRLNPSTFDDTSRVISETWPVGPLSDGCHQITLVVAHESNWLIDDDRPDPNGNPSYVATATWWINVNPPPGERFTLKNCPSGQLVQQ